MMNGLLISVVIPVYNVQNYLEKCIGRIINQTYRNIQIVLVDDGSTDQSGKMCDIYAGMDSRVEVVHKENGGLVSARKAGADHIRGEYVLNIDSDDWVELDYVEKFADAIIETGANQIWSISFNREYDEITYINKASVNCDKQLSDVDNQQYLFDKSVGKFGYHDDIPYYMWSKCIKTELFKQAYMSLHKDIDYMEDVSFSIRCLSLDSSVYYIDNPGYHYVQRSTSISHVVSDKDRASLKALLEDTLQFLYQQEGFSYTKNVIEQAYIRAMMVKDFSGLQDMEDGYLVPYKKVKRGSRIIVYGMGNVGKSICKYVDETSFCEIVACSDSRDLRDDIEKEFVNIKKADDLDYFKYDYIIIATTKNSMIEEIRTHLVDLGIDERKIDSLSI